jgi:hypothetical protein
VMVFADDPDLPDDQRKPLADVYKAGGWRALARGRNGTWHAAAAKADEAGAVSAALAACALADRDCEIRAIGHFRVTGN